MVGHPQSPSWTEALLTADPRLELPLKATARPKVTLSRGGPHLCLLGEDTKPCLLPQFKESWSQLHSSQCIHNQLPLYLVPTFLQKLS